MFLIKSKIWSLIINEVKVLKIASMSGENIKALYFFVAANCINSDQIKINMTN
jgi:hypothetical protein